MVASMKPQLVIIGLGNPGASYEKTRHNAGFQAIDVLSEAFGQDRWQDKPKFDADIQEARIVTAPVLLVKPKTYMNRSGESASKIIDFYKLDPSENVLVLVDDIDIPLGDLRLRLKGGPGTHNGLKSLVQVFGEEFPRLRIGIGSPEGNVDLAAWVLSAYAPEERDAVKKAIGDIPERVTDYVLNGAEK